MSWRGFIGASLAAVLMTGAVGLPEGLSKTRPADRDASVGRSARGPCLGQDYLVRPRMLTDRVQRIVKRLIRCAVERWPVPGGAPKAIAVAECESSLWPWAIGGDNLGVYQHKAAYWQGRVRALLRERWFSARQWARIDQDATEHPGAAFVARANVLVAVRMASAGGWGPWSCA